MRRTIFSKRMLALVLATLMTLSVVYVPAFATGSEAPAEHVCDFSGELHVVAPDHVNGKSGYSYYECQVEGCDKVHILNNSLVDPDQGDHVWEDHAAVAPTCTTAGNVAYKTCKAADCDVVADENGNVVEGGAEAFVIPALGHKFTEWTVTTDYLCTDLHTSRECLACGFVESVEWNETYHNYQPVFDETYVAPLCNKDGEVTFKCVSEHESGITCSAVQENVKIRRTNQHITTTVEYVAPTCTEEGMQEYYVCTMCNRNFSIPNSQGNQGGIMDLSTLKIDATGHDMSDYVRVEGAACGVANNMISVCKNGCGHETFATEDHDWSDPERIPNLACGTENNLKSECSLCGEVKYETQGHNYKVVDTKETVAYCEKTVVTTYTCEYCNDTYKTTTVEEYHVNVNTLAAVTVTCANDGLTEGKQCADCGKVIVAQEVISSAELKAAHEAAGYHNAGVQAYVFPTCTEVGYTTGKKCTECDVVVEAPEQIPATGHKYNTEEIPATCQADGYRVGGICLNEGCGYIVPGKTIPMVAECVAKDEKVLVSEATCTSPAIYKSECKWCGTTLENIPQGEKNPDNHSGTVAIDTANSVVADCLNDGYAFYGCSDCDFLIKIIPNGADKTAHEADDITAVMTEDEFKAEYANVLTFTVTATGHNYPFPSTDIAPTCTEDGYQLWVCQNPGCSAYYEEYPEKTGHTEGEVVVENNVAPDCVNTGSYDNVVYCSVCNAELSRTTVTVDATGHTEGDVVVENNVAPQCTVPGSYDNVVYCSVCNAELSRTTVTVDPTGHGEYNVFVSTTATCIKAGVETYACANGCGDTTTVDVEPYGHTKGDVVIENNVDPQCTVAGSYEEVVYCTRCNEVLSREVIKVNSTGHTPDEKVVENNVDPTCVDDGHYDEVVYCSVCGDELSRNTITVPKKGHTPEDAVNENVVDADCLVGGSYDSVVYCADCDIELSRETITVDALGHTPSDAVEEPGSDATCTEPGHYFLVTYCSVCSEEIDRTEHPIEALGHTPADAVREHVVEATCTTDGSYDSVVYCSVCDAELSRETITVDALGHTYDGYKSVVTLGTCDNGAGVYVKNCSVCDLETEADDSETVVFDRTVCDHGTQALVDGEIVYVPVYGDNKNQTIDGVWTYVPHVHNNCQTGTVGGYICGTCGEEEVIDSNYADKAVGSEIEATHDCEAIVHDATCMTEGYIEMKCACGYSYTIDESYNVADMNDKTVHNINGYSVIKVLASCENPEGIYVEVCEDCGKTFETKVTFNGAKGHGYVAIVNGELVTVDAYTNKNTSTADWTYIAHVSNKCQEGTVGGWVCGICDYTEYENADYEGKLIGSKIKPSHNMRADAQTPSCEGIGVEGWTYHEYCLDCDLGNDPVRDGWTVLPCTPCVTVTVGANAPTCTEAGNNEYSYKACCATKAEIQALAEANVIPATNHAGTVVQIQTAAATCTTPSFVYEVCTACNGAETFTLISYIAPLGHNVVSMNNGFGATCTVDGKESDKECDRCHAEDTFVEGAVIPATGHTNLAGDTFYDADKCSVEGLADDRFCVTCQQTIDFTHRYDVQIFNATCQTGEIHINTCVDCNTQKAMEVVRGPWTEEEHREAILATTPVVTPATPTEYGKEVYTCPHCDETIVINKPLAGGIEFGLDYNVVYPVFDEEGNIVSFTDSDRKETANGTWIAVDVLVYSNSDFHFSQIDISLSFNNNLKFYDAKNYVSGVENFVVENVTGTDSTVKISAGIDPNADMPFTAVDTVGDDADGVVLTTVYFMVAPQANVGDTSVAFAGNQGVYLTDDTNAVVDITMFAEYQAEALAFTSKVLGDYYADGVINGVELLLIKQMINGQLDETYDVTLDLNKDGEVTVVDYEIFKALVNFENTLNNEAYAEVAGR